MQSTEEARASGNKDWPKDAIAGAVSGLLGIGFLIGAMQIEPDPSKFSVLGPRVAPTVIGIATVLFSLALIVQAMRRNRGAEKSTEGRIERPSDTPVPSARSPKRLLVTFSLFTAYILLFIPLGYVLSTFVFLLALTTYVDRKKFVRNGVFAAVFSVVVYCLFVYALQVQLPTGLLG